MLDGGGGVGFSVFVNGMIDAFCERPCGFIKFVEIIDGQFRSAGLVVLPAIQSHGRINVSKAECFVKTFQVGLVDSRNGEPTCPHVIVVDEVGKHLFSAFQAQFVGNGFGDEQLVGALLRAECGDCSVNEVFLEKRRVEVWTNTFEHYSKKVAISLQHSLLVGIALHMLHTLDVA